MNFKKLRKLIKTRSTTVMNDTLIRCKLALWCIFLLILTGCGDRGFLDHFTNDGNLDPSYRWFDEGKTDSYEIKDGWLRIKASRGEDLWGGIPIKRGAPLMLRTAPTGDYEVECIVDARWSGTPQRINTQVGLFVFEDVENWLFFGFTNHSSQGGALPQGNGLIITSTIGDASKIRHYQDFAQDSATLKIERSGDYWRFYVKAGASWNPIGPPIHAHFENHEAGMGVKSFKSGGTAQVGNFDDFWIR